MQDFVLCVRAVKDGQFAAEVGSSRFLIVPPGQEPAPSQGVQAAAWYKAVRQAAVWKNDDGEDRGDILMLVHGYNESPSDVMQRHRRLRDDLVGLGFKGVVASFDWPSDDNALAYLADRHRAKMTALLLVTKGIAYLSKMQTPDCTINVHIMGHSTGAYVIREAFDDADDTQLSNPGWNVSQVVFAAGDVSAASMSAGDGGADSVYRHCVRLTNYSSRHDRVLDISNVKRLGIQPRVGRVALPPDAPSIAVNVDCSGYYKELAADGSDIAAADSPNGMMGVPSHSWHFGNLMFTRDLLSVIIGQDRNVIPTREKGPDGALRLRHIAP